VAARQRRKLPPYPCRAQEVAIGKAWDELQKMGNQLSDARMALDRADRELMDALHYDDSLRAYVNALQGYCDMMQGYVDQLQQAVDRLQDNLDRAIAELSMHGVPAGKLSHQQKPGWVKVATGLYAADQKTATMAGAAVDPGDAALDVLSASLELDNAEMQVESADSDLTDCTTKLDFAEGDLADADAMVQTRVRAYAQAKDDDAAAQARYREAKAAYDAALEALSACRTRWAEECRSAEAAA
jgi:chromosome segregation ATPase